MLRLDMHMIAGVLQYVAVASFAEAWIENETEIATDKLTPVASFAEACIEIGNPHCSSRCCYVVSSQRYNYNSLQNNKCIDEKFYKHFMMAVLFDCFAFVY